MAKMNWTPEQHDAIYSQNGTILVSAAAGSGKTAVLVQRAISRITEGDTPVPANQLLIVTFTRAAAGEMRARLEKRLHELIKEQPDNQFLKKQSILLSGSKIGTIHSFCADILREFFHVLNIPQDFKIITDKQEEDLQNESVQEAISNAAESETYDILADNFAGEREDSGLSNLVLRLYSHMSSYPEPLKWLKNKVELYKSFDNVGESIWGEVILDFTYNSTEYVKNLLKNAVLLAEESGDEKISKSFLAPLLEDIDSLNKIALSAEKRDWNSTRNLILNFSSARAVAPRGYKDDPFVEKIKNLRTSAGATVTKNLKALFVTDEQQSLEDFTLIYTCLEKLYDVLANFSEIYSNKKLQKNFLDYGDLEQYTLKLLQDENGNKSIFAEEISQRFSEIMIDEYQDMNEVQDTIFNFVSKNRNNLFMVGDVKQSIYGFRRAMPEIFMRSRDSFAKYNRSEDSYPAYVLLERNFRSRREVTESTNFVFSQLMKRQTAGMDYTEEEALVYGANYSEKTGCETELTIIRRNNGEAIEDLESSFIAKRIKELVESGFTVEENGHFRQAIYSDFCILLRSANKYAHVYAENLSKLGIPAKAANNSAFFESKEIGFMLSLLRVIDNPNQDIPLISVLMSPVYGFSPDDMLALREKSADMPIYTALLQNKKHNERFATFINDVAKYRAASATMPSDEFISLLYQQTGYADIVLAMPEGNARRENLRLFQAYAAEYEASGYKGISGFVRFLNKLERNRSDMKSADTAELTENCVQIISVHKSKGLEFPVCFLAGCGREKSVIPESVLFHSELGIGISLSDRNSGTKFSTIAKEAIKIDSAKKDAAEEMRILYVAMTRAKEKLIMVGAVKKADETAQKLAAQVSEDGISAYTIQTAKSFAHWLLLCAMRHPNADYLRTQSGADSSIILRKYFTPWNISIINPTENAESNVCNAQILPEPDLAILNRLENVCGFKYAYNDITQISSKAAASALAAKEHEETSGITLTRPSWLFEKGLTPAEKGIALHSFMQFADFKSAAIDPKAELERLIAENFISPHQASAVDLNRVSLFFESSLGKRILNSDEIHKERRFTVEIPAEDAGYNALSEKASIVLQGALDCTFTENGQLHIVDFKTDRVKDPFELAETYAVQIKLYKKAMQQISDLPVGDCWIYSMHKNTAVPVKI